MIRPKKDCSTALLLPTTAKASEFSCHFYGTSSCMLDASSFESQSIQFYSLADDNVEDDHNGAFRQRGCKKLNHTYYRGISIKYLGAQRFCSSFLTCSIYCYLSIGVMLETKIKTTTTTRITYEKAAGEYSPEQAMNSIKLALENCLTNNKAAGKMCTIRQEASPLKCRHRNPFKVHALTAKVNFKFKHTGKLANLIKLYMLGESAQDNFFPGQI